MSTTPDFNVLVGLLGSEPVKVRVKTGATVGEVLTAADVKLAKSSKLWVNGEPGKASSRIKKGDIISVVSPKAGGTQ